MNINNFISVLSLDIKSVLPKLAVYLVLVLIILALRNLTKWLYILNRRLVALELTPTSFSTRQDEPLVKFLWAFHKLHIQRPIMLALLGVPTIIPLETVVLPSGYIKHYVLVDKHLIHPVEKSARQEMPNIKLRLSTDYITKHFDEYRTSYFRSTGKRLIPSKSGYPDTTKPADKLARIVRDMMPGDSFAIQVVIMPIKISRHHHTDHKCLVQYGKNWLTKLAFIFNEFSFDIRLLIAETISAPPYIKSSVYVRQSGVNNLSSGKLPVSHSRYTPTKIPDTGLSKKVLSTDLFRVKIRIAISCKESQKLKSLSSHINTVLDKDGHVFNKAPRYGSSLLQLQYFHRYAFFHRLPSIYGVNRELSPPDIAHIYQIPVDDI